MELIYEFTANQVEQLHALYECEWWTEGRTLEETQSGIDGSQICIGVVDENGFLLGFTRVITDYTFKALIFDFIVSKKYRGSGIGLQLMQAIKSHPKLISIKHFELYCLPELEGFYKQYGFSSEVGGIQLMRQVNA